jgi:phosphotransferase system IIA component
LTGTSKVYNRSTAASASGTAALSGIVGSDTVSLTGTPTFTFASSNVGTGITITTTGYSLTGTNAGNYTLTQPSLTANITAKPLTVTGLTGTNKVYNRSTAASASGTAALSGVEAGDTVSLTGTPTFTFASANVGTGIGITTTGYSLTGGAAGNYSLTQPTLIANITAKPLTFTGLTGNNKVYILDDSETKRIPLSCESGEQICYGAWVDGEQVVGADWGESAGDLRGDGVWCVGRGSDVVDLYAVRGVLVVAGVDAVTVT